MKRVFKSVKNILILLSMLVAIGLLIHDFIFWGIIPFFSHTFYEMTYLGLFVDLSALGIIEVGFQYFKELFK
jgi:hypothetical protein